MGQGDYHQTSHEDHPDGGTGRQPHTGTEMQTYLHVYTLVNLLTSARKEIQQILKETLGHRKRSTYRRCEMSKDLNCDFENNQTGRAAHVICHRTVNHSSAMRGISSPRLPQSEGASFGCVCRTGPEKRLDRVTVFLLLTFSLHHAQLKMKTCVIFDLGFLS